ncbi:MAG: tRNA (adenosine(37)-N6)-threonylcarbamoyltransferase complex ATPase subunit type 1 TsaE [Methylohalobius sp.]|nr:tRNA (adenosine(37)-N6)-threonylcarbamoyltransferase complex ATPase subunit type 1 TsaE [Methylohalobius sp.]
MALPPAQPLILFLPDLEATRRVAAALCQALEPRAVVYLKGPLGAGKTTLVRAVLEAAGFPGKVKSPTFTLVETYWTERFAVAHFDLYRLAEPEELEWIGFRDYLQADTVCFIEWPERGQAHLPAADLELSLRLEEKGRILELRASTPTGQRIFDKITQLLAIHSEDVSHERD